MSVVFVVCVFMQPSIALHFTLIMTLFRTYFAQIIEERQDRAPTSCDFYCKKCCALSALNNTSFAEDAQRYLATLNI